MLDVLLTVLGFVFLLFRFVMGAAVESLLGGWVLGLVLRGLGTQPVRDKYEVSMMVFGPTLAAVVVMFVVQLGLTVVYGDIPELWWGCWGLRHVLGGATLYVLLRVCWGLTRWQAFAGVGAAVAATAGAGGVIGWVLVATGVGLPRLS